MPNRAAYQPLWFKAVHGTITKSLQKQLDDIPDKESKQAVKLICRLAVNTYLAGDYISASKQFETICNPDIDETSEMYNYLTRNASVYQTAGKCSVHLFLSTQTHSHLENAYQYYQTAVDNLQVNLFTMYKLPVLLLEFGVVLEYYGAFESALEVYSRIMTNFPNFRGYFDALYRTAIVTRHLASLTSVGEDREEAMNKCVDILQFLLEALPANISDVSVIWLC